MKIIITGQEFEVSETSNKFLKKYLERMKTFIKNNKIEDEVYDDIEERISEIFSESKKITDKIVIDTINEIGEPDEIFSELLEEISQGKSDTQPSTSFKEHFAPQGEPLSRNPETGIFYGICSGIAEKYNLDPLWVRLGFIFGTFMWGMTIILYIVLIFLLPIKKKSISIKIDTQKIHDIAEKVKNSGKKIGNTISNEAINIKNKVTEKYSKHSQKDISESTKNMSFQDNNTIKYIPQEKNIMIRFLKNIINFPKKIFIFLCYILKNIINFLKKILIFLFHSGRIFLAIFLIIISIPVLISLLFTSGILFTDIVIDNQNYFEQIDLFFKIGIVGILFSLFFLVFGFILKLLYGKVFANALMINGLIGIIIFIFIGGIGFFNSLNNFTQVHTSTQKLVIDNPENKILNIGSIFENKSDNFSLQGANWIESIQLIPYDGENIELEITSIINTKNNKTSENIFQNLTNFSTNTGVTMDIKLDINASFQQEVNYHFLRKTITFYIPKNKEFNIGEIGFQDEGYINNFKYNTNSNHYYPNLQNSCSNKILYYNQDIQKFECK